MDEMTSFGLVKGNWLRDDPEGAKIVLKAWDESDLDVKVLAFYIQTLEQRISNLRHYCRTLELKLHNLEIVDG